MSDRTIPSVKKRNDELAAAIIADPDTPIDELCQRFAVEPPTIYKLRATLKLPTSKRRGPRKGGEHEAISPLLHQIGREIYHCRVFMLCMEVTEAAFEFKISRSQLVLAERGAYNFSFTQLEHVASKLGVSLAELLTLKPTRFVVTPSVKTAVGVAV